MEHFVNLKKIIGNKTEAQTTLSMANPKRRCANMRNFRGNGPEDVRLIHDKRRESIILLYPEYIASTKCPANYARIQYVRRMDYMLAYTTPHIPLRINDSACIEKNWMPLVHSGAFYTMRWVNRNDNTEVLEYDDEFRLKKKIVTESSWLRRAYPNSLLSGGTPFVRYNKTHHVGIGHVGRDKYFMHLMFLAVSSMSISSISSMFYFDTHKMMHHAKENDAREYINFPMNVHVTKDGMVKITFGINDKVTHNAHLDTNRLKCYSETNLKGVQQIPCG